MFYVSEEHPEYDDHIHVYTRVGGNNRGQGYGEEELESHPEFVATFDDSFDNTYGTYVFKIPEKWKADYEIISKAEAGLKKISKEYQQQIRKIYPKLKDLFDELWGTNG